MFGMSSEDFWENDPQLYWAYRTFYFKKIEQENQQKKDYLKYETWLKGSINFMATTLAINNSFNKDNHIDYPSYEELFTDENEQKNKKIDVNIAVQEEFNAWARY